MPPRPGTTNIELIKKLYSLGSVSGNPNSYPNKYIFDSLEDFAIQQINDDEIIKSLLASVSGRAYQVALIKAASHVNFSNKKPIQAYFESQTCQKRRREGKEIDHELDFIIQCKKIEFHLRGKDFESARSELAELTQTSAKIQRSNIESRRTKKYTDYFAAFSEHVTRQITAMTKTMRAQKKYKIFQYQEMEPRIFGRYKNFLQVENAKKDQLLPLAQKPQFDLLNFLAPDGGGPIYQQMLQVTDAEIIEVDGARYQKRSSDNSCRFVALKPNSGEIIFRENDLNGTSQVFCFGAGQKEFVQKIVTAVRGLSPAPTPAPLSDPGLHQALDTFLESGQGPSITIGEETWRVKKVHDPKGNSAIKLVASEDKQLAVFQSDGRIIKKGFAEGKLPEFLKQVKDQCSQVSVSGISAEGETVGSRRGSEGMVLPFDGGGEMATLSAYEAAVIELVTKAQIKNLGGNIDELFRATRETHDDDAMSPYDLRYDVAGVLTDYLAESSSAETSADVTSYSFRVADIRKINQSILDELEGSHAKYANALQALIELQNFLQNNLPALLQEMSTYEEHLERGMGGLVPSIENSHKTKVRKKLNQVGVAKSTTDLNQSLASIASLHSAGTIDVGTRPFATKYRKILRKATLAIDDMQGEISNGTRSYSDYEFDALQGYFANAGRLIKEKVMSAEFVDDLSSAAERVGKSAAAALLSPGGGAFDPVAVSSPLGEDRTMPAIQSTGEGYPGPRASSPPIDIGLSRAVGDEKDSVGAMVDAISTSGEHDSAAFTPVDTLPVLREFSIDDDQIERTLQYLSAENKGRGLSKSKKSGIFASGKVKTALSDLAIIDYLGLLGDATLTLTTGTEEDTRYGKVALSAAVDEKLRQFRMTMLAFNLLHEVRNLADNVSTQIKQVSSLKDLADINAILARQSADDMVPVPGDDLDDMSQISILQGQLQGKAKALQQVMNFLNLKYNPNTGSVSRHHGVYHTGEIFAPDAKDLSDYIKRAGGFVKAQIKDPNFQELKQSFLRYQRTQESRALDGTRAGDEVNEAELEAELEAKLAALRLPEGESLDGSARDNGAAAIGKTMVDDAEERLGDGGGVRTDDLAASISANSSAEDESLARAHSTFIKLEAMKERAAAAASLPHLLKYLTKSNHLKTLQYNPILGDRDKRVGLSIVEKGSFARGSSERTIFFNQLIESSDNPDYNNVAKTYNTLLQMANYLQNSDSRFEPYYNPHELIKNLRGLLSQLPGNEDCDLATLPIDLLINRTIAALKIEVKSKGFKNSMQAAVSAQSGFNDRVKAEIDAAKFLVESDSKSSTPDETNPNDFMQSLRDNNANPAPTTPYRGIGVKSDLVMFGAPENANYALQISDVFSADEDPWNNRFLGVDDIGELDGALITQVKIEDEFVAISQIVQGYGESDSLAEIAKLFHAQGNVEFKIINKDGEEKEVTCDNSINKTAIYAPTPSGNDAVPGEKSDFRALSQMLVREGYQGHAEQVIRDCVARKMSSQQQEGLTRRPSRSPSPALLQRTGSKTSLYSASSVSPIGHWV